MPVIKLMRKYVVTEKVSEMFKRNFILLIQILLVSLLPLPALALDTDIFQANPGVTTPPPNVMILIDNTANWSATLEGSGASSVTKFDAEIAALKTMIAGLDSGVNVGLMLLNKSGSVTGGYVRFGLRPMTSTNKTALTRVIDDLDIVADKTAGAGAYGTAMFDLYKYLGGGGTTSNATPSPSGRYYHGPIAYLGHTDSNRDYENNSAYNPRLPTPGHAFSAKNSSTYLDPMTDACQKNYLVVISNGSPPTSSDSSASWLLGNVGGNTTSIPLSSSRSESNLGDEFARFLYNTDVNKLDGQQNVVTYSVAVYKTPAKGQDPDNVLLMKSMASQGRGRYFDATDQASLNNALTTILTEIQAIDSVFSSVTLPVSVNVRGTNLNQVYLGAFRPDGAALPYWDGNLKQYQLAFDEDLNTIFLADRDGNAAMSASTGFIVDSAKSYWTESSSYWDFDPSGNPLSGSDLPDGSIVEKGGVAQQIREVYANSPLSRNIYTCTGVCLSSSGVKLSGYPLDTTTFNPNTASVQALFNASSSSEVVDLFDWMHGKDNYADENADGNASDIRARVHGDVLHSRPAVVNYNRNNDDSDVYIFYGSNDGTFRAVKGGRNSDGGRERWALVLEEHYGQLSKIRDNNVSTSVTPKPIFVDGSVVAYTYDHDGNGIIGSDPNNKVYLYLSMRRGGRFIYAIDVTNPDIPKFLWRKSFTDAGFSELGQTWSALNVGRVKGYDKPLLFFGGGYDPNVDDLDPVPRSANYTMGRAIYAVDAFTGSLVWQAGPSPSGASYNESVGDMTYAIPSDVTLLDRDRDGYIDRLYVGDMGGQVWRVDVAEDISDWEVNKIASLGHAAGGTNTSRRKFFYPPDVVMSSDANGEYDAVIIGSGDRENPFNGLAAGVYASIDVVENHFYMIKDRSVGTTYTGSELVLADLYDATDNKVQDGSDVEKTIAAQRILDSDGVYLVFGSGEKTVTSTVTLSGTTYFSTNQPSASSTSCSGNLGVARQYRLNFANFSATRDRDEDSDDTADKDDRATELPGGGLPPSPVPIVVELNNLVKEAICSGVSCEQVESDPLNTRYRTFWYEEFE